VTTARKFGAEDWVRRIREMTRYKTKAGTRAPYKPLLLLWLIGRVANGEGTSVTFAESEQAVAELLASHALAATVPQARYPFVYLASDAELWSVRNLAGEDISAMPQHVRENTKYLRNEATGQVAPRFAAALGDRELRNQLVNELLQSEFPETLHGGILTEVGLTQHIQLASTPRDPRFQRVVPMAYEYRCSFCEFGALMRGDHLGLDAAHIRMHSKAGSSTVDNGILLCALHHRLFDKGALGMDGDLRILVSQQLTIVDNLSSRSLLDLSGRRIRLPQRGYDPPAIENIEWHHENLFRKPARAAA